MLARPRRCAARAHNRPGVHDEGQQSVGYGRYVGRVGALAVALGVGFAVGDVPVAWADDTSSAPAAESRASDQDPSPAETTDPKSDDDTSDDTESEDVESGDDDAEDDDLEGEEPVDEEPAEEEPTGEEPADATVVETEPADDRGETSSAKDDEAPAEPSTPAQPAPQPVTTAPASDEDDTVVDQPADDSSPTDAAPTEAAEAAALVTGAASRSAVSHTFSPAPVTETLTAPANAVRGFVSNVLSWMGINPQGAINGPSAPAQNPTIWAVLAWLRREIDYTFFNRSPHLSPALMGQTTNGALLGDLFGSDFHGQPLTYSGTGETPRGRVIVDPRTGAFTYQPSAEFAQTGGVDRFVITASNTSAYRLGGVAGAIQNVLHRGAQILGLAQPDTVRKVVEVTVVTGGPMVIAEVRVIGEAQDSVLTSADGTRTYRMLEDYDDSTGTATTTVVIVDTVTGKQIGDPVTVDGRPGELSLSPDGALVVHTAQQTDRATGTSTTTVVIIDARAGGAVTAPVSLEGERAGVLQWSDDGSIVFQAAKVFDPTARTWSTSVYVFGADGLVVADPITVSGLPVWNRGTILADSTFEFNDAGTRAYLTTHNLGSGVDATTPEKTWVSVIDTATWTLVGDPVLVDGKPSGPLVFSLDDTRLIRVTTVDVYFTGTSKATVAVLDAVTGQLIGDPVTLDGYALTDPANDDAIPVVRFSPDGTRAYVSTNVWDPVTFDETTQISVFDVASGSFIGTPIVLQGRGRGSLQFAEQTPDRLYQRVVTRFATDDQPARVEVAVIDAVTGTVIGTVSAAGVDERNPLQFNADGSRAILTTIHPSSQTHGTGTTMLTVIDTATGTQVGDALTLVGEPSGGVLRFSADDTRAYLTLTEHDLATDKWYRHVVVLNAEDGTLIGSTALLGHSVGAAQFSDDGTRLYVTTDQVVAVFDASTGDLLGTAAFDGTPLGRMMFSGRTGDVGYLTVTKEDPKTDSSTTTVVVIDSVAGGVLGEWETLSGSATGAPVFSTDGTRAYRLVTVHHPKAGTSTTVVATYDTGTGNLVGLPFAIGGLAKGPLTLSADGTRLELAVARLDPFTGSFVTNVITLNTGAQVADPAVQT